jgi:hypothetical protein
MSIDCVEHGTTQGAFICQHLLSDAQQLWCSERPSAENPCPDAWCLACDEHFQAEGEWNKNNEGKVPIKLVCQGCYTRLRLGNTER